MHLCSSLPTSGRYVSPSPMWSVFCIITIGRYIIMFKYAFLAQIFRYSKPYNNCDNLTHSFMPCLNT